MPKHDVGTREEWKTAVEAVHERELGRLDDEIAKQRQEVPWVRVEKDYVFGTEAGKRRCRSSSRGSRGCSSTT